MNEKFFFHKLINALLAASLLLGWAGLHAQPAQAAAARPQPAAVSNAAFGANTYKALVTQEGIYRISFADLQAAGAPLDTLDPHNLQLFNLGSQVAIRVVGEEDGRFDAGDYVLFYGQPVDTRYTGVNVYYLALGAEQGLRMLALDGAPQAAAQPPSFITTQHIERNLIYSPTTTDPDGDLFIWGLINAASNPASANYSFTLENVDLTTPYSVTLSGKLADLGAYPEHHTRILLNGSLVGDLHWAYYEPSLTFSVQLPQRYLLQGANTIKVELPRDNGISYDRQRINWFELTYRKTFTAKNDVLRFSGLGSGSWQYLLNGFSSAALEVYDISDPARPAIIQNAAAAGSYSLRLEQAESSARQYLALSTARYLSAGALVAYQPVDLKSSANAADYILITPPAFYNDMLPLAAFRSNQGLRVKVVTTDQIYDEFSGGLVDPQAIHDFLAAAYTGWTRPAPRYVLLAGDGNYDPRNYQGAGETSFIPAYILPVDYTVINTATDNRYVTVSGDDNLPEMAIGRLPVKTSAEAQAMVSKLIAYEQAPAAGGWNSQVLFISDNPDAAGDFYAYSNGVADGSLPAGYTASKIYYADTHATVDETRTAIIDQFNQGRLIVNYVGHGYTQYLGGEKFLQNSTIPALQNAGRLPLFITAACSSGSFQTPSPAGSDYSSLAEALVKAPTTGAIASFSSTGFGTADGQDYLDRGLFQSIFKDGQTRLGDAVLSAKQYLAANTIGYENLIDIFTLFGDPATRLNVLPSDLGIEYQGNTVQALQVGDTLTYTLAFSNSGQTTATHIQVENLIPEGLAELQITTQGITATPLEGDTLTWQVQDMLPGASGSISIVGTVSATRSTQFTSLATIRSSSYEDDTTNNSTTPVRFYINQPTAVQVSTLTAVYRDQAIVLRWEALPDERALGFNLYRSQPGQTEMQQINAELIPVSEIGKAEVYTYVDAGVTFNQRYTYWLEIVSVDENSTLPGLNVQSGFSLYLPLAVRPTN
ncbi:MAG: C25 family cysteine peptidase [Chloroflexota bacterium]